MRWEGFTIDGLLRKGSEIFFVYPVTTSPNDPTEMSQLLLLTLLQKMSMFGLLLLLE